MFMPGELEERPPPAPTIGSAAAVRELLPQRLRGPGDESNRRDVNC